MNILKLFLLFATTSTLGQVQDNQAIYKSEIDQLITIKKIGVLPFSDNLQGIYARPLQTFLMELVQQSHRWDFTETNFIGPVLSPDEIEMDAKKREDLCQSIHADAFFVGRASKGPKGVTLILHLYLKSDHQLFLKAELRDYQRADLESVKSQLKTLYQQILSKVPYSGRILSRQGNRVTINLGTKDGIAVNQVIPIIQIISLQRHPKFKFLIQTEKEILGKIKILKADDTLSFAIITTEREKGAIQKEAKLGALESIQYSDSEGLTNESGSLSDLTKQPGGDAIYGSDPAPWVPTRAPSFGIISARLGLGTFSLNSKLQTAGAVDSSASMYPSVALDGELWITEEFSVHASLRQGILSLNNSLAGSTPGKLSASQSSYEMLLGYNFRFGTDVWSPKVEALIGYNLNRLYVDDSNPTAFTSMDYSGIKFGVDGYSPITTDRLWGAGAQIFFTLSPSLSEKPASSGASSKSTMNQFAVYGYRKLGEHLKLTLKMDFELYSTTFTGTGTRSDSASSTSQKMTTLSGGISYLF